ncbi:MAG: glycosyltransferase family 2 protein [Planctomycetes bacterium]|nr:glycosyltransferase family 2 protein [Planctomycetota bacterium]
MAERLAIAVPFYAGLEYLREALASARAQTDGEWTLTVVDDSPEKRGGRELVASFGDPRLRYLANDGNLGMVACWNRCLAEVELGAELLTLLHADDRLLPGYVAAMKGLAAAQPRAVALFCAARTIGADGRERFSLQDDIKRFLVPRAGIVVELRGEAGLRALMRGNFVVCPTLCFRRGVLGTRRFETRWHQVQDLELLTRLLFERETLCGLRAAHYAYRRHTANATAQQTESLLRFEEEFAVFDALAARAAALGWTRAARTSRQKTILRLHLGWRALAELARLRPGTAAKYARFLARR